MLELYSCFLIIWRFSITIYIIFVDLEKLEIFQHITVITFVSQSFQVNFQVISSRAFIPVLLCYSLEDWFISKVTERFSIVVKLRSTWSCYDCVSDTSPIIFRILDSCAEVNKILLFNDVWLNCEISCHRCECSCFWWNIFVNYDLSVILICVLIKYRIFV